ncbi:MAG TPA: PIN domain-containing protein [Candidatus Methylomirabilis sp.]|nr:PIN domain-containing protein [Candidatus Methylomirabilis sp.]
MRWAILDTTIYIGHWERGLYEDALAAVRRAYVIRHSAVVLSELRRGARTGDAQRLVDSLYRLARIRWEPTVEDWWEAGKLIRKVGDAQSWDKNKRRDFQNDALIALTARRHGATVVTANRADFELLTGEIGVSLFPV